MYSVMNHIWNTGYFRGMPNTDTDTVTGLTDAKTL